MNLKIINEKDNEEIQQQNRELLITPLDKQCEAGDIFIIQKLNKLYTLIKLNSRMSKYIIDIANNEFFKNKHNLCPAKYFEESTRQDVINYLVHELDINANDIQCFPIEHLNVHIDIEYNR
jgi:hypothetical protein